MVKRGADLTELVWQLILLTSAADVALDNPAVAASALGMWSEHTLEQTDDWVAEDAWPNLRIGDEVEIKHSVAFLGPRQAFTKNVPQIVTSQDIAQGDRKSTRLNSSH